MGPCGSASLASRVRLQSIVWEERGRAEQGKRRCRGGLLLPASLCPLESHLLVTCHSFLGGSRGWEWWAEWQSGSSVLSVPSPCTRQGLAGWDWEHRAGEGGRDLTGSTFFFTQPTGVRQHLSFSLDNIVCSRPVPQARKKIFLLKKKKRKEKVVLFKRPLLIY